MQFTELTIEEFDQFTRDHFSHFTQTKENYLLKVAQGVETYLVGVKDDGSVRAACLVTLTPMMKVFKYAYGNRGPVMDYSDKQVFDVFFHGLHQFLKPKKVMHVRIDPYEVIKERNHDGEVIKDRGNRYIFDYFKDQGFRHDGFTTGFDPVIQIRWHSVLDLKGKDPKTILDDMDSLRKRNIKKAQKHGLHVRYLELDEIDIFRKFMRDTSEKKAFVDRDDAYYISRKQHFGDNVIIPLVYVNLDEYTASIAKDRDALLKNMEKANKDLEKDPENQKAAKKIANLGDQLKNIEDKLAEGEALRETHGEELPIASAYYFITPHEVVYLAGGSDNEFRHFAGSYLIQWHMINYALEQGIDLYNFYGISGDFTEEAEDYGVIQFKRGFNAKVFEYAGDFTRPVNVPAYRAYQALTKLRDRIGR
ncbi:aminoacyltransferase [Salinicoccus sp. ID82-1]|uniref:aminoacyltransferase n=1 Tax=Salinicoccus sp. ID82-1 TaxID=2820269 RepID=UPI001F3F9C57|nr:aminoacyltransferase [Salinicoccus sp. ID82-1]MCG1009170.1 aminoacyltransferase [Salinicoccus sp. ID82-1]